VTLLHIEIVNSITSLMWLFTVLTLSRI